jgi:bifunctional non-homologous end joining protein LigD
MAKLDQYRTKRDAARTPEPMPTRSGRSSGSRKQGKTSSADERMFVIQEHHASSLHWDFRLERDGVLVSWAIPKGLPPDPKTNHLAVHVEDHPLEYADFEGDIGAGQYGAGKVTIWDRGSYRTEKWSDREVKVVLNGERAQGRFVLFQTGGKNWMIHRMDTAQRADWEPLPDTLTPMLATLGTLPADDGWAFEMKWDGLRAIVRVDGGRVTLISRNGNDITGSYPELRGLGEQLGTTQALLDGEIVSFDSDGHPSFAALQRRMHVGSATTARRLASSQPVVLLAFDLLHLDGRSLLGLRYDHRREALEGLALDGPNWQTPPAFAGSGSAAVRASVDQGLEGVVAKRRDSRYQPGHRSQDWIKVKNVRTQEVVVGGWTAGKGRRAGGVGALLLGLPGTDGSDGLRYVGKVGTGFTEDMLDDLHGRLRRLARKSSPFAPDVPRADARDAQWVTPKLVGEVAFGEWTGDERLRHPSWRGLRPDKAVGDVRRES